MFQRALPKIPGLKQSRETNGPRVALSPALWGVSDVPGWGHQFDAERVLADTWGVGVSAIEAGPPGFLPDRSVDAKPMLQRHWLKVVAGQAHAILHDHDIRGPELAHIDGHASWLAALGAQTLVLSAIPPRDTGPAHGIVLSSQGWAHLLHVIGSVEHVCARHRMRLAVQPRYGTMIQGPADIEKLLVGSEAGLCLDIGHLVIAGADPLEVLELAGRRIQHVRLNDVDAALATRVRDNKIEYADAVSSGLFKPLGTGDAEVDQVVEALRRLGYRGWYAIDEDIRLASDADDPLPGIRRALKHVRALLTA